MLDAGHVSMESGYGVHGPLVILEPSGRSIAENHLYERSNLARRRKAWSWVKDKGGDAAGRAAKLTGNWIVKTILALLGASALAYKLKAILHSLGIQ
jgi:hypothetical protein